MNFKTLKDMILEEGQQVVHVTEPYEIRTDANKATVKTVPFTKTYRMVYTKRRIICDIDGKCVKTVPYGWVDE